MAEHAWGDEKLPPEMTQAKKKRVKNNSRLEHLRSVSQLLMFPYILACRALHSASQTVLHELRSSTMLSALRATM